MQEPKPDGGAERFEVRVTSDSHFAWLRTRLSVERTLMSWVRTATALIGFGFTIVQFFQRLGTTEGTAAARLPEAPRYLGLALILAGVLALAVSIWQYRSLLRYLWSGGFARVAGTVEGRHGHTPLLVVAIAVMLIGIFAFFAVFLRIV